MPSISSKNVNPIDQISTMPGLESGQGIGFLDWGLIEYQEALDLQETLVADIFSHRRRGVIVFCSHPPVVTLGRKTQPGDVFDWNGPLVQVSRGGRATYHGPNQLVVYPLINLNHPEQKFPRKDIGWFLRNLEDVTVAALKEFGVPSAIGKTAGTANSEQNETGVWVSSRKVASLGICIRHWITFHGIAINLHHDPQAFRGLLPCGFQRETMTSVEELTGKPVDQGLFQKVLMEMFCRTSLFGEPGFSHPGSGKKIGHQE